MKLKHIVCTMFAGSILLYETGVLGLLVSAKLVKCFPWLYAFLDYLLSALTVSLIDIICCWMFKRVSLELSGFIFCLYLSLASEKWCSVNRLPAEVALLRWLLGTANTVVLLVGIGLIFGDRSWIRLTRK